jgi:hypothetical protein
MGPMVAVLGGSMGLGSGWLTLEGAGGSGAAVGSACKGLACVTRIAARNAAIRSVCRPIELLTKLTSP